MFKTILVVSSNNNLGILSFNISYNNPFNDILISTDRMSRFILNNNEIKK